MPYKNKEDEKKNKREYYKNNREKISKRRKLNYNNNPEKMRERAIQYYKDNWEKNKKRCREYRRNNPKKSRENYIRWYKNNPERKTELDTRWHRNKRKTDLKYNLSIKIGNKIRRSLKRNAKSGKHWEDIVGYTVEDLEKRLRKTMPKEYTWKDFKNGELHIDHIIPISAFNYTKSEHIDFKRCWALKNLRLLPAKENLIKHNKLIKSFQPSLKISI